VTRDQPVVQGYHNDVRDDVAPYLPAKGGVLVDIGGGTGATAAWFKAQGYADRVGVFDQVSSAHAEAGVDFHQSGDLEDHEFLDRALATEGPFDTILTLDILEHLVDPWAVVTRLHGALKPGGHIVASIPNVRHYRVAAGLLFKDRWDLTDAGILDRTHLRFFVRSTAIALMTHSGLELVSVDVPPRMRRPRLARVLHVLGRGRLDSLVAIDYVIVVRKPA
jgi:2-polyprenyl-3-methyl-5-hydroxy-6-metoxy-1,4-benzoquinol methylase